MRTTPVALLKESAARTYVAPTSLGCVSATWQRDRHVREREANAASVIGQWLSDRQLISVGART